MPADTTETVVKHSARLQPSINLHAPVTAFMFSCSGTQCNWNLETSVVEFPPPYDDGQYRENQKSAHQGSKEAVPISWTQVAIWEERLARCINRSRHRKENWFCTWCYAELEFYTVREGHFQGNERKVQESLFCNVNCTVLKYGDWTLKKWRWKSSECLKFCCNFDLFL